MFDNVLVGVDARPGSLDAIALASRLALPGAQVTLGHVYSTPGTRDHAAALALSLEVQAAEHVLGWEPGLSGLPSDTAAVYGSSVAHGLHELAEQLEADLLVVGSCHRGVLGRAFLGDDASRALDGAPCAVAVAPHGFAAAAGASVRLSRIGVGWDPSSDGGEAPLRVARTLAARHRSAIEALSVVSLGDNPYGEHVPDQWPKLAGELVVEELHRLDELGGVTGDATYGDPGEKLTAFSERLDLLIIGSPEQGPSGRVAHGTVSRHLVRHAKCPLLVVPRSAARKRGRQSPRTALETSQALS